MNKLAPRLVMGWCLAAASIAAHAELQLTCPIRWDLLSALEDRNPDKVIFGVKVRDWKPEYFDAMQLKNEECMTKDNYSESVKRAMRRDIEGMLKSRDRLKGRDDNLRAAEAMSQAAQAVDRAKQQGVDIPVDSSNRPREIVLRQFDGARFPELKWNCRDTGGRMKFGWLNEVSIIKLSLYTDVCLASGAINQDAATVVQTDLEALARFYAAIPAFAKRVDAVAARPDASPAALAELDATTKQLLAPIQRVSYDGNYHPLWQSAVDRLGKLHEQVDRKACDANYAHANLPAAWRSAYYLFDYNSPTPFIKMVCDAMGKGVQIRYLSGGVLSKEGFEVKNAVRTVQVFPEAQRMPGGDPKAPLLVPSSAKIDGKTYSITTQNLRSLTVELGAALQNQ